MSYRSEGGKTERNGAHNGNTTAKANAKKIRRANDKREAKEGGD